MKWARLGIASLGATCALALALTSSAGCGSDDAPGDGQGPDAGSDAPAQAPEAAAVLPSGPRVECTIGAAIEGEPNDTPGAANAFDELGFCGVLETAADVDYFTFDTPAGTKLGVFQAIVDGKVEFDLTLKGATFGPSDTPRFGSGTYLVKAFTTAGKPASYRLRVQFDTL